MASHSPTLGVEGQSVGIEPLEPRRHFAADLPAINAGGRVFTDSQGIDWTADADFSGGTASPASVDLAGTTDEPLYASRRKGKSFTYQLPLATGDYVLELRFAETYYNAAGRRLMNITAEGSTLVSGLDLFSVGGYRKPITLSYDVRVTDGTLNLGFVGTKGDAAVSGVRLLQRRTFAVNPLSWQSRASSPQRREEAIGFVFDNRIFTIGGYINDRFQATRRVDRYDPSSNTWRRLRDAPTKITHAATAIDTQRDEVWMLGGYIGDFPNPRGTTDSWIYSPRTDSWRAAPSLPIGLGSAGAAVLGRTLYVFGGGLADRSGSSSAMWSLGLDNPKDGWTSRADMPVAINHFGYAVVGERIYVVGGQFGLEDDAVYQPSTFIYDPQTDLWSSGLPMPRAISHFTFSTVVYRDRYILTFGGEAPKHGQARGDCFAYDTLSDRWARLTSLPEGRRTPVAGIVNDRVFVTGGWLRSRGMTANTWSASLLNILPFDPPPIDPPEVQSPFRGGAGLLRPLAQDLFAEVKRSEEEFGRTRLGQLRDLADSSLG
jgi:N-acetylneuraminic acid mutarotase